jgi:hypothetical protein
VDQDYKSVSEALDPAKFAVHVTRTALLLEQLARDVRELRDRAESNGRGTDELRGLCARLERDAAVFKSEIEASVKGNREGLEKLEERLRWLSRVVLGAVVTGVIGGLLALIFKLAG